MERADNELSDRRQRTPPAYSYERSVLYHRVFGLAQTTAARRDTGNLSTNPFRVLERLHAARDSTRRFRPFGDRHRPAYAAAGTPLSPATRQGYYLCGMAEARRCARCAGRAGA